MTRVNLTEISRPPSPHSEVIDFFRPKPSSFELKRVGGNGDGAYLVPQELLPSITLCFSAGCENRKNFEDVLTHSYGVACHLLDYSSDPERFATPFLEGRQFFLKKWLRSVTTETSISLSDWVATVGPSDSDHLLLQMDIEGAEYENLISTSSETLAKFSIMVIEFHSLVDLLEDDSGLAVLRRTIEVLNESFVSIHARANNCCGLKTVGAGKFTIPKVLEVTFVRKDLVVEAGARRPLIPHPADISRNVESAPPLHLGKEWQVAKSRPFPSKVKILSDWLNFAVSHPRSFLTALVERAYSLAPHGVRLLATRVRRSWNSE